MRLSSGEIKTSTPPTLTMGAFDDGASRSRETAPGGDGERAVVQTAKLATARTTVIATAGMSHLRLTGGSAACLVNEPVFDISSRIQVSCRSISPAECHRVSGFFARHVLTS